MAELRRLIRRRPRADGVVVLEGLRTVDEALAAGLEPWLVAVPQRAVGTETTQAMLDRVGSGTEVLVIADAAFDSLAPAVTPQPLLAVMERPPAEIPSTLVAGDLALVLVGVADPGNVGTIIRCADACAARCVVVVGGADPWAPKTVRASAGSVLRVPPVCTGSAGEALEALGVAGATVVATDVRSGVPYDSGVLGPHAGPVALVVGSEAHGLDRSLGSSVHHWVRIPMAGATESLNVAMATTLLAFEYRRRS